MSPVARLTLSLLSLSFALACAPEIGDSCTNSTDCSQDGLRICDTTQPGGYCTVFNCDDTSCPDEAVCVNFGALASTVGICEDPQKPTPYARSFCMKTCSKADDCRSAYKCTLLDEGNPWGAQVVEHGHSAARICMLPPSGTEIDEDRSDGVCRDTSSSTGGEGGQSGAAGAPP